MYAGKNKKYGNVSLADAFEYAVVDVHFLKYATMLDHHVPLDSLFSNSTVVPWDPNQTPTSVQLAKPSVYEANETKPPLPTELQHAVCTRQFSKGAHWEGVEGVLTMWKRGVAYCRCCSLAN